MVTTITWLLHIIVILIANGTMVLPVTKVKKTFEYGSGVGDINWLRPGN